VLPRALRRVRHCGATYRVRVETIKPTCVLCGELIDADQATMVADGATAHAGCVYGEADVSDRGRWMPSDLAG